MDRSSLLFWAVLFGMVGASTFFAIGAEQQRESVQQAQAPVQTGQVLSFAAALDGDTVLLRTESGEAVTVRIVGIKAFDRDGKEATSGLGQQAIDELSRILDGARVRIELHEPQQDPKGRTLATLFHNDADVGLSLVRDGLVLVYTPHPFPAMAIYLEEQARAREKKHGVWGNQHASERAAGLVREWRVRQP